MGNEVEVLSRFLIIEPHADGSVYIVNPDPLLRDPVNGMDAVVARCSSLEEARKEARRLTAIATVRASSSSLLTEEEAKHAAQNIIIEQFEKLSDVPIGLVDRIASELMACRARALEEAARLCDARAAEIDKGFGPNIPVSKRRRLAARSGAATALAIGIRELASGETA